MSGTTAVGGGTAAGYEPASETSAGAGSGGRRARREAEQHTRDRGGRLAALLVFLLPSAAALALILRGISAPSTAVA